MYAYAYCLPLNPVKGLKNLLEQRNAHKTYTCSHVPAFSIKQAGSSHWPVSGALPESGTFALAAGGAGPPLRKPDDATEVNERPFGPRLYALPQVYKNRGNGTFCSMP